MPVVRRKNYFHSNLPNPNEGRLRGFQAEERSKDSSVQKRPYEAAYYFHSVRRAFVETAINSAYTFAHFDEAFEGMDVDHMYNVAFDRFQKHLGERGSLALTLLDAEKSIDMIVIRSRQLVRLANFIRKGNIAGALHSLGDTRHHVTGKVQGVKKTTASTWLEFTFGWQPLVQDIHDAVSVLQQDFGTTKVRGRMKLRQPVNAQNKILTGDNFMAYELGASVWISNPNLRLATQLGMVNPAAVAWDAVPFSFCVDWFLPVGKFLNSYTNDFGLSQRGSYVSVKKVISDLTYNDPGNEDIRFKFGYWAIFERRIVNGGFPVPSLLSRARLPDKSLWLAATSLALAVQQISKLK